MPETVGQQLNRIRSEQKLTLEQAAHATHIRIHYLRALEEDQPDVMPSVAQGRGFLRLYASYLNIPNQPLLNVWPDPLVIEEPVIPLVESSAPAKIIQDEDAGFPSSATPPQIAPAENLADTNGDVEDLPHPAQPESSAAAQPPPQNSLNIFASIGSALRQQRETLSLSISDIENHTHIRSHYLEAIENGRFSELPSPAQGRGMLKNYAQFLNMNPEAVLLEYAEGLQVRRIERIKPAEKPSKKTSGTAKSILPPAVKRWLSADMIVGVFAILLLVSITIWGISQVSADRAQEAEPTAPPVAEILLLDTSAELTQVPQIQQTRAAPAQQETSPANENLETNANLETGEEESGVPTLDNQPLQLYLITSQRAWLRITADEEVVFEGRVVPGNAYPFSAADQIDLLTGNAAAIKVYFNQQDLGVLGEVGEVVNVSFTAAGVIVPTPRIPPTPTATLVPPTVTPQPTSDVLLPTPTVTPFIP